MEHQHHVHTAIHAESHRSDTASAHPQARLRRPDCLTFQTAFVFAGQSTITFIYDFVERFEGPHPGYAVVTGRLPAGTPIVKHLVT